MGSRKGPLHLLVYSRRLVALKLSTFDSCKLQWTSVPLRLPPVRLGHCESHLTSPGRSTIVDLDFAF
jgi:hypothetical protein